MLDQVVLIQTMVIIILLENGGYSVGTLNLLSNTILYVVVGGKGADGVSHATENSINKGGYNGGGGGRQTSDDSGGAGGGATHIATKNGMLSSLSSYKSDILIVAGGGGGDLYDYICRDARLSVCGEDVSGLFQRKPVYFLGNVDYL